MKANEKELIDGLAKKAFESIVEAIPEGDAPAEAAYRIPAHETRWTTANRRTVADPFPLVACALALIVVIPSARGMARTAVADAATAACESGRFDGSEEFMTMVFARGGERLGLSRGKIK